VADLEDNKRRRRISESEEAALLAVASPHLRSMIIAALDPGMRRAEMLALRFGDIDRTRRMITLRAPRRRADELGSSRSAPPG
jgi:integrase